MANRARDRALTRLLLVFFLLGNVASGAELLLLEHTAGVWQLLPLVLLSLGTLAGLGVALRAHAFWRRALAAACIAMAISGPIGLVLHYRNNAAFELEMQPAIAGWELFWETLHGAVPALAPGMMLYLGCMGMAYLRLSRNGSTTLGGERNVGGTS